MATALTVDRPGQPIAKGSAELAWLPKSGPKGGGDELEIILSPADWRA
jgi:hypothetical protein